MTVNLVQDPQSTPEPSTLISLGLLSLAANAPKRKAS
ncbi:PEP-CTERM sorting domain-containing protein [Crocosphaera sp.]